MPQSLSFVLVHLIFSTKQRLPLITPEVRTEMHPYLATVARGLQTECLRVGGVADHVHLALRLPPAVALAKVVQDLKTSSSKWAKTKGVPQFAWQRGYAAFSVSPSKVSELIAYIDTQETHHAKRDFQGEMRALFAQYGVAFDERYVWD
jgi:REP element-mobilizing transposase RayT